jgi:hypothetical protein
VVQVRVDQPHVRDVTTIPLLLLLLYTSPVVLAAVATAAADRSGSRCCCAVPCCGCQQLLARALLHMHGRQLELQAHALRCPKVPEHQNV